MKQIIKYQAIDGNEFFTSEDCIQYENFFKDKSELIEANLIVDNTTGIYDTGIQNKKEDVLLFREKFVEILRKYRPYHYKLFQEGYVFQEHGYIRENGLDYPAIYNLFDLYRIGWLLMGDDFKSYTTRQSKETKGALV